MNNFFIRDNDTPIYHIEHEPNFHHTSNSNTANTFPNAENFCPATDLTSDFVPSPTPSSLSTAKTSLFSRNVYQNNSNSNSNSNNNSNSSGSNSKLSGNKDQFISTLSNSASTSTSSAISTLASATAELKTTSIPLSTHTQTFNLIESIPYTNLSNSDNSKPLLFKFSPSDFMSKQKNSGELHAYKHNNYYQQEEDEQQQIENNNDSQIQSLHTNYDHFNRDDNNSNQHHHHHQHHQHHHHQHHHQQPHHQHHHPSLDNYAQQKYIYNNLQQSNTYKQNDQNSPNNNNNSLTNENFLCYPSKSIASTESGHDYPSTLLYTNYPQNVNDESFHSLISTNTANDESLRNVPVNSINLSTTNININNDFTFPQPTNSSFTYPSLSNQSIIRNTSQLQYQSKNNELFDYSSSQNQYLHQTALGQSNINRNFDINYQLALNERNRKQTSLYTDPSFQPPSRLSISQNQTRQQIVKSSVPWTYKESKQLMRLREKGLTWKQISQSFKNRTLNACQFKWKRIVMNGGIEFSDDENDENENNDNDDNNDENDNNEKINNENNNDDNDDLETKHSESSGGTFKEGDETIEKLPHPIFTPGSDTSSVGMKRSSESEADETEIKRHKLGVSLSQIYNSSNSIPLRYSINQSHRVRQPIPGSVFASESSFSSGPSNTEIDGTPYDQEQEDKEDDFLDFSGV